MCASNLSLEMSVVAKDLELIQPTMPKLLPTDELIDASML